MVVPSGLVMSEMAMLRLDEPPVAPGPAVAVISPSFSLYPTAANKPNRDPANIALNGKLEGAAERD